MWVAMITVGGMIGLGKTTVTEMISKELGFEPFYESVEGNTILPLFYTASKEEQEEKRYPFLLQLEFLNSRFETIKSANNVLYSVLDRSVMKTGILHV